MTRLALVELARKTLFRGGSILSWLALGLIMIQVQSHAVSYLLNWRQKHGTTTKELREKRVLRAIIRTFNGDQDSSERLLRQAMNIVRSSSKTWSEDVTMMCRASKETSISQAFYILIRETDREKCNTEYLLTIYTLFFDVVTEIDTADEVTELGKFRRHLIEFYGTAGPLF